MLSYIPAQGEYSGPGWGDTFHHRCERCGTTRATTIDSLGEISTRHYVWPDGYAEARREALLNGRGDLRLDHLRSFKARRREARRVRNHLRSVK
jgi:hypothetical protein